MAHSSWAQQDIPASGSSATRRTDDKPQQAPSAKPTQGEPAAKPSPTDKDQFRARDRAREAGAAQGAGATTERTRPAVRPTGPVQAEPAALDFGFMAPGADASAVVKLSNIGASPVTIKSAKAGCKCTTINSLDGAVLEPGASVDLDVKLSGAIVQGARRASITVSFEGGIAPLVIPLQGEVALPVRAVPPYINLVGGGARTGRIVVESNDKAPFKLLAVDGKPPVVTGGYDPATDAPRANYLLEYDLTSVENPEAYMLVETDRADCPILDIRIRREGAVPRGTLRLADYRLNLGAMRAGESKEVEFNLLEPAELTSAVSGSGSASVQVVGSEIDGKITHARLRVMLSPDAAGLVRFPVVLVAGAKQQELSAFVVVR